MKPVAVLCFPGTLCDQDIIKALKNQNNGVKKIWHTDCFSYKDYSAFVIPGGFSYGDYLRSGALAAHSVAIKDLQLAAQKGKPILGICNGFQILCEARLLEGTLQINQNLLFIDEWVELNLCNNFVAWGKGKPKKNIRLPIAHQEGRFYASKDQIKKMEDQNQIWWQYKKNVNGSSNNIAGIMNKKQNVAGLMPHPERAMLNEMGGTDGADFFKGFI